MIKIGSHVGMSGPKMFLGSVMEALSYNANTFMFYTGAPQNTKRKDLSELKIEEGKELARKSGICEYIVHAPYIINLANAVKAETFKLGVDFLQTEIQRAEKLGASTIVLHPGSSVGMDAKIGIAKVCEGLNEILTSNDGITISLETMAGKGSEVGRTFEELSMIFEGTNYSDRLRVCFDTCHVHDAGYDIVNDLDSVFEKFDKIIGKEKIRVFHINDSKNPCGAAKDRHENIGAGMIGLDTLRKIVHYNDFEDVPKILETPYRDINGVSVAPYKEEIELLLQ